MTSLLLTGFRAYDSLEVSFGPGPHLVWGPNAAGKTSLLEAIVLLARGSSHRTGSDVEMIRWAAPFARVSGRRSGEGGTADLDVTLVRDGPPGGRKRLRVNGAPRRIGALAGALRTVVFAPEEMLLLVGAPSLRRAALDALATQRHPAYAADLSTYGRALTQRNHLLRAIRDEQASRDQLSYWDAKLLDAGTAVLEARHALLRELAAPLAAAHAEIAPEEDALRLSYVTNAPPEAGETPGAALARRLHETAEKELWNGTTLVGPHRDDLAFAVGGRNLSSFASRGQQRTAILAFKLAEFDLLTALDGRPPLLLLDDVFSELDRARRAHLVRRIATLPQAFVTTTTLDDLDPALRAAGTAWRVDKGAEPAAATDGPGASLVEASA
ncbi:MAG TPA: DNA replication/repair protein RecF [Patescibacteria group bacterium]|nr:DNA replication/repair protein RecF [Patescibacteria group bacterium]